MYYSHFVYLPMITSARLNPLHQGEATYYDATGAGACSVVIVTQATSQGFAIADQTVSVPATTGDKFIGPFPASLFNDASEKVSYTLSDTVGLSVAVIRL